MQSVSDVSNVISSVKDSASQLEGITRHFKSNPDGKIILDGGKYEGFIPAHGTFVHYQ